MIVSGGLRTADAARRAYEESGADAVMIARGSLGNPWIFEQLTGARSAPPERGRGRGGAALGPRSRRRALGGASGRPATCASSTPGTSSGSAGTAPTRTASSARRASIEVRELLAEGPPASADPGFSSRRRRIAIIARRRPSEQANYPARFGHLSMPGAHCGTDIEEEDTNVAREALITQEGLDKLKSEIDHLSTVEAARGRRADQGSARVRRHRRELRVRRRQERAGPARAADRPARGAAAPRQRRRREADRPGEGRRRRRSSTSRTRSPAIRASSRSSARPRPTRPSRSSPTSRRSARR